MAHLVFATRNAGKISELQKLLPSTMELVAIGNFPQLPAVEEDGDSYQANALKKARAMAYHTGLPALADDSGLEVVALGGQPGLHSARYAHRNPIDAESQDAANNRKLLAALAGSLHRTARFVCTLAFFDPTTRLEFFVDGTCDGAITTVSRGQSDFGYDPLFVPKGFDQTFAELPLEVKNQISHRARAFAEFVNHLASHRF